MQEPNDEVFVVHPTVFATFLLKVFVVCARHQKLVRFHACVKWINSRCGFHFHLSSIVLQAAAFAPCFCQLATRIVVRNLCRWILTLDSHVAGKRKVWCRMVRGCSGPTMTSPWWQKQPVWLKLIDWMWLVAAPALCGAPKGGAGGAWAPQSKIWVPCNSSRSEDFFLWGLGVWYLLGVSYDKQDRPSVLSP
jgi:hypothetical protein